MGTIDDHWEQQFSKTGSFLHDVARGRVRGSYQYSTHGVTTFASATDDEIVRPGGGNFIDVPNISGVQMSVVSTAAADTFSAGTGIRSIILEYLDGNLDTQEELIILDGLTPVLTAAIDIRWIQTMTMVTAGSNLKASGDITMSNGGVTYIQISVDDRTSHTSLRRVPRGKRFMVDSVYVGVTSETAAAKAKVSLVATLQNKVDQQETGLYYHQLHFGLQDSSFGITLNLPVLIPAGHIFGLAATIDKAASISGGVIGWIEDDDE